MHKKDAAIVVSCLDGTHRHSEHLRMTNLSPNPNPEVVTFYYNPMSRGRTVHWLLEELGCEYEIKNLDWAKADHKSPEYLKINPMGKIPAIIHRNTVVTETPAIIAYLADAFSQKGLAPALNDPKRGTYYRWMFFAAGCLEGAFADAKAPRTPSLPEGHLGYGNTALTISTLEKAVENGYITGKFSAADLYLASYIGWALSQKDLPPTPAFTNYVKLCTDRPSWKSFNEKAPMKM